MEDNPLSVEGVEVKPETPTSAPKRVQIPSSYEGKALAFRVVGQPTAKLAEKGLVLLQAFGTSVPFNLVISEDQVGARHYGSYLHATIGPLPPREGMPTTWAVQELLGFTPREEFLASHGIFAKVGTFLDTEEGREEYKAAAKRRLMIPVLEKSALAELEAELLGD